MSWIFQISYAQRNVVFSKINTRKLSQSADYVISGKFILINQMKKI